MTKPTLGSRQKRRFIRMIAVGVAACAVPPQIVMAAGKQPDLNRKLYHWYGFALGAEVSLQLYHNDAGVARRIIRKSVSIIHNMEQLFSLYRQDSSLSVLNRDGVLHHPPAQFVDLLQKARTVSQMTSGAFDITVQPLWQFYHAFFSSSPSQGPSKQAVEAVDQRVDYKELSIGRKKIMFKRPGMAATLNGIAQGYATDRVSDYLKSAGMTSVLVDIGEYRALGSQADSSPWRIALEDPENPGIFVEVINLTQGAVATSSPLGDIFDDKGIYNHLFIPDSGMSATRYTSVTVTAPTATLADGLSTAFCVMAESDIAKYLQKTSRVTARLTYAGGKVVTL